MSCQQSGMLCWLQQLQVLARGLSGIINWTVYDFCPGAAMLFQNFRAAAAGPERAAAPYDCYNWSSAADPSIDAPSVACMAQTEITFHNSLVPGWRLLPFQICNDSCKFDKSLLSTHQYYNDAWLQATLCHYSRQACGGKPVRHSASLICSNINTGELACHQRVEESQETHCIDM